MDTFDLLDAVLPDNGWFAVVGIKGKSIKQELVQTRQELNDIAQRFIQEERNVFFGCAKYATDQSRTKANVLALKSMWLDIDSKPSDKDERIALAKSNTRFGTEGRSITPKNSFKAFMYAPARMFPVSLIAEFPTSDKTFEVPSGFCKSMSARDSALSLVKRRRWMVGKIHNDSGAKRKVEERISSGV
jgi:hypothetical protein